MVNVILDTNIYGKLFDDKEDGSFVVDAIRNDPTFVIHNLRLIRNELRRVPKILPIYDSVVSRRIIDETKAIKNLAQGYFKEYKRFGGVQRQTKIISDFKIIASATLLNCDIVFSDDKRTMQNPAACEAYKNINLQKDLRTPIFYSYQNLKKRFL